MSRHNCASRNPQVLRVIFVALCLMCLIPAGSSAEKAREVVAKPAAPKPGGATIYFIRGPGIKGFWVPEIDVDDKKIGALLPAPVLTVSRPAGHHTIDLPNHIMSGSVHSEIDLTAGQTYYLEWGPYQDP